MAADWDPRGTYAACATATGGTAALVRLSGPSAFAIAARAGLPGTTAWRDGAAVWDWGAGPCPCRVRRFPGPRSATGCDLTEILLPGSRDLVEAVLDRLAAAGADAAPPGAFARQALANGRITLDQAEALVALADSTDGDAAIAAIGRMRSGLALELEAVRQEILGWRAAVEAGLDFAEEPDVRAFEPRLLSAACRSLAARLGRWLTAADAAATGRRIGLCGAANAGKSSLFTALTGEPALVAPEPGTTRDWLEGPWPLPGGPARLIDTAGWTDHAEAPAGVADGLATLAACDLVLVCIAPDALPPACLPIAVPPHRLLRIATKTDIGPAGLPADCAVSARTGDGLADLALLVDARLAGAPAGLARQQLLLDRARSLLDRLGGVLPSDELLADDLRTAAESLASITGSTADDHLMAEVFSRFCIGK